MPDKWQEFGQTWETFVEYELAKPGTVVIVNGYPYLIGHLNELGGVCDDCVAFAGHQVVEAFRQEIEWPPFSYIKRNNFWNKRPSG